MTDPTPPAEKFAVIDFFGHKKLAGRVSEVEAFGGKMGRLDVFAPDGTVSHTRHFTPAAVYGLEYVTEAAARLVAAGCDSAPVKSWDLPQKVKDAIRAAEREVRPAKALGVAGDPLPDQPPYHGQVPTDLHRLADDGGPHAVYEDDDDELGDDASDIRF